MLHTFRWFLIEREKGGIQKSSPHRDVIAASNCSHNNQALSFVAALSPLVAQATTVNIIFIVFFFFFFFSSSSSSSFSSSSSSSPSSSSSSSCSSSSSSSSPSSFFSSSSSFFFPSFFCYFQIQLFYKTHLSIDFTLFLVCSLYDSLILPMVRFFHAIFFLVFLFYLLLATLTFFLDLN